MNAKPISKRMMTLVTKYSPSDLDWVKYVHDHYKTIFQSCSCKNLAKEEHFWKYYRLEDYLYEELHIDPNIAWIVLYINQLPSDVEFKEIDTLLLPELSILDGLYQSYQQAKSHVKSCRYA